MNYVFFDLYHTASDALPMYIKAKKFEKKNPNAKFEYWIEDSILALERRIILDVFFMEQEGNMQEIIKKPKNKLEEIELKVYEYLKDYAINTYEDLYNLLCDAQLKEIAEYKLPDLNCDNIEAAMKIVAGSARNMGIAIDE
jgi:glucan phosphorylase